MTVCAKKGCVCALVQGRWALIQIYGPHANDHGRITSRSPFDERLQTDRVGVGIKATKEGCDHIATNISLLSLSWYVVD